MDPELLRLRRAAEGEGEDPLPRYRYRVAAVRAGRDVRCTPGDRVALEEGGEGRVVRVEESLDGVERVAVRADGGLREVEGEAPRVLTPHRPASLLGEAELGKRLEEDLADPHEPRAIETLGEVARRKLPEGLAHALELFARVEERPRSQLRQALVGVLRSRPFGEVEAALLKRRSANGALELAELPPLAAAAPTPQEAEELLDRLEAMPPDAARRVVVRAGRCLVGLGGPGFASGEVRARVGALSRDHTDRDLRVALFVHAVPALQDEAMLANALRSETAEVRRAAAGELLRRGRTDAVEAFAREEAEPETLRELVAELPGELPLELVARLLEVGRADPVLEERALLRLAEAKGEAADAALALLAPWLEGEREPGAPAAVWAAGMLGRPAAGAALLALLNRTDRLACRGLALEALARLEHPAAAEALDTWGVELLRGGPWGEELVDTVGLLLGHPVDAGELLGRFLIDEPRCPARASRALDAARALLAAGEATRARAGGRFLPTRLARFRPLAEALGA